MTSLVLPDDDKLPVDWGAVDDACYDWLNDLLSMDDRIIWNNQKVAQPAYPYLSLLRNSEVDEGGADEKRNRTLDADGNVLSPGDAAAPFENEEIAYQPVKWTLSIQAHADPDGGGNDPNADPMKLLSKAKRSLGLTSINAAFHAVGFSLVQPLDVLDVSVNINGQWIRRASLDVFFRTASVMSEKVGFIDKAQIVSTQFNVDVTVDAS